MAVEPWTLHLFIALAVVSIVRDADGFLEVEFMPGKLGLTLDDPQRGIVGEVAEVGQAKKLGVEAGMKIVSVGAENRAYDLDSLVKCVDPSMGNTPCKFRFALKREWMTGSETFAGNVDGNELSLEDVTELFAGGDSLVIKDGDRIHTIKCCCLPGKDECKLANSSKPVGGVLWSAARKYLMKPEGCLSLVGVAWHSYHRYAKSCRIRASHAQILREKMHADSEATCEAFETRPELHINVQNIRNIGSSRYRPGDHLLCRNRRQLPYVRISFAGSTAKTKSAVTTDGNAAEFSENVSLPVPADIASRIDEFTLAIDVFDTRGDNTCAWQGFFGGDSLIGQAKVFLKSKTLSDPNPTPLKVDLWRSNKERGILSISIKMNWDAKKCHRKVSPSERLAEERGVTREHCNEMKRASLTQEMLDTELKSDEDSKHALAEVTRAADICKDKFQIEVILAREESKDAFALKS